MSHFRMIFTLLLIFVAASSTTNPDNIIQEVPNKKVRVGAERTDQYLHILKNKRIGLIVNQTSTIRNTHIVDSFLRMGINIKLIFSPEHGFRGNQGAGEHIKDDVFNKKKILIRSLYGANKKPKAADLKNIDILVFDIQDVGVRFYTYISTMFLAMEACAENNIKFMVLDRPNPNGFLIDGPVLNIKTHRSFVGMLPLPISHGLSVGELANMINGEKWLRTSKTCKTIIIPCKNWEHKDLYNLPIKPSPNLGSDASILLYPSLCLFEGTKISIGRGTYKSFEVFGAPWFDKGYFTFIPKPLKGMSTNPKYKNQKCRGMNLKSYATEIIPIQKTLHLKWLILAYKSYKSTHKKEPFFSSFFNKLAGNDQLQQQIKAGKSISEIKKSWEGGLKHYNSIRKKYLLYP